MVQFYKVWLYYTTIIINTISINNKDYFDAGIGDDILEIYDAGRSAFTLVRNYG